MNTQNLLILHVFQSLSRNCKSHSRQCVLSKKFYPFSVRMHNVSGHRKPANHRKVSPGRNSKRCLILVSKTNNLDAKTRHSGVRKTVTAHKRYNSPAIKHLFWHGETCLCSCCSVQKQELDYSVSYKVSTLTKVPAPNRFVWKRKI